MAEVLGRVNLGEGLLTTYGPDLRSLYLLDLELFGDPMARQELIEAFDPMCREILPVEREVEMDDRRALDAVVMEVLGAGELLEELYRDLVDLAGRRQLMAQKLRYGAQG